MEEMIESETWDTQYDVAIFVAEHAFTGLRTGICIPHRVGFQRRYLEYMAQQMLKPGEMIVNRHRLSQELGADLRVAIIEEEGDEECSKNRKKSRQCASENKKSLLATLMKILFRIRRT